MVNVRGEVAEVVQAAMAAGAGVTVIRAAPGAGKSAGARDAVVACLEQDGLRALWAVQSTIRKACGPDPLAQQVADDFGAATGRDVAQIIVGRRHLESTEYEAQFTWERPVAVISHAHLPLVLRPDIEGPVARLRSAHAIIVDEDPLASLLLHGGLRPGGLRSLPLQVLLPLLRTHAHTREHLAALAQLEALECGWPTSLATLLHDVQESGIWPPGGHARHSVLRGAGFWSVAGPALDVLTTSPTAQAQLQDALAGHLWSRPAARDVTDATRQAVARFVVEELLNDLQAHHSGETRRRFCLRWKGNACGTYGKSLGFDLLPALHVDRPMIVLDAYADEAQYRALFGADCRVVDVGERPPLRVQLAPDLALDSRSMNSRKLTLVAGEIQRHSARAAQGQLLLVPQKHVDQVCAAVGAAAGQAAAPPTPTTVVHWFAGRGRNTYAGMDTRALMLPHLPGDYETGALAALYPLATQTAERRALRRHHERAELLQLLHRGRQGQHNPAGAPRAILHGLPCELCPRRERVGCQVQATQAPRPCGHWQGLITVAPYGATVPVKRASPNPLARTNLTDVARDLHRACGGVPLIALEALGICAHEPVRGEYAQMLQGATETLLAWAKRDDLPTLGAWRRHWRALRGPYPSRRAAVWPGQTPLRDNSGRLAAEVLGADPWGYQRVTLRGHGRTVWRVWAADQEAALAALRAVVPGVELRRNS